MGGWGWGRTEKKKDLMVGKFQNVLGGKEPVEECNRHHRAVRGETRRPRRGGD